MIELNYIQYELHWHIMGVDMQNQRLCKKKYSSKHEFDLRRQFLQGISKRIWLFGGTSFKLASFQ